ncbi:unnamed protein product [Brassicogethes aeneus]|uniref:Phospholipase n=1 Tax=Brassicogethes aeneus TaxID=1431903 RepID=A0A9P0BFV6_BRAAE|nr:unnamed protein product [Brassicogethes aeneus]
MSEENCLEETVPRPSLGSETEFDDQLCMSDIPDETLEEKDENDVSDSKTEESTSEGLPFCSVYNIKKFKSSKRNVFIPSEPITATITDYERNVTTHMLNPNLYTISLCHGNFTWQVKKRYKQIYDLHQQLLLHKASLMVPLPTKTHASNRKSFRHNVIGQKKKGALPRFPKKPEVLVPFEAIDARMKQIEDYLNNIFMINAYRKHPATIDFLEVSHLSFIKGLGIKGKEGLIKKKTGNAKIGCNCFGFHCFCCIRCQHVCNDVVCSRWLKRWFFIKDTFFGYINPETGQVRCVILFDQGFEVASGFYAVSLQTGFQIQTLSRQITFKCWTRRKSKEWVDTLKELAGTTARDFTQPNPHHSFAPIRTTINASWFVDGSSYMSAVADAIEGATEEVFITDWWLSPEIYLKRPAIVGDHWRLDKLLERKANAGVKIFILLYKEVEMALGLNSYYSKQKLAELSENIKVLRHPDHAKAGVLLWAHHEKLVVVDQNVAFVGGIDLCYGRWDDPSHRLTDLGSITPNGGDLSTLRKKTSSTPGGEPIYSIPVPYYQQTPIPEVREPEPPREDEVNRDSLPQLEPGDNLMIPNRSLERMKMNTPEMDRKNVFYDFKNTVKSASKGIINLVYTPHEDSFEEPDYTDEQKDMAQTPEDLIETLDGSAKLWVGKDYVNFIVKDFTNLDSPFDDFIDRGTTPRMPWHDVGMCVQGSSARDVARHFIQRWNACKLEKCQSNDNYPYLMPKCYDNCVTAPKASFNTHQVTCQVLRSVSTWSIGFLEPDTVEQSIHEAYIDTITRAQHYIYIENQFFISISYIKNQIADAIFKRIIRAYKGKETFRVYVVMPLLPGFEGEVGGTTGTSLHAITHWNYASISRDKNSLLNKLKAAGISDPSEYISFYGLRNHSVLNREPITELIYVHSKLMIVDDKIVICGSANINDRSMIGKRDSEVAVIIEDETFEDGLMNNDSFPSGHFAGSLRKHLFKEHLGILGQENSMIDMDVTDPVSDYFYKEIWQKTAALNTEMYEKVFHCLPSDKVETFTDLRRYQEEKPLYTTPDDIPRAQNMLETIQGHIVQLPLNFLCKENLTPAASSVEGMMPTSLWT